MSGKEEINEKYSGFMRRAEQLNKARIKKVVSTGRRNRSLALTLTACVGSIYLYSIFAVKQEKFLDEVIDIDDKELKQ